jgi:predicted transcriptional regulator
MDPVVYTLLAVFVPGCTIGTILGLAGIYFTHKKDIRSRELAADLITQMLNRKMSVEEIERLLLAWSQDPELAKSMRRARKLLGEVKAAPNVV